MQEGDNDIDPTVPALEQGGKDDGQESTPPGNEGEGEGSGGSDDKRGPNGWIPKVRFDEVLRRQDKLQEELQAEREQRIRLEERVKAGGETKPKTYTRAELLAAVENGQITQAQADEAWEAQITAKVTESVTRDWMQHETARERAQRVSSEISRYKAAVPDVTDPASDTRRKVAEEFQYLVSIGQPRTVETELAALRSVLGPVDRLEKRDVTREKRPTHQEGNGGGGRPPRDGGNPNGPPANLPPRYKAHYERMIEKGMYSGWDDKRLQSELKRANPQLLAERAKKYG